MSANLVLGKFKGHWGYPWRKDRANCLQIYSVEIYEGCLEHIVGKLFVHLWTCSRETVLMERTFKEKGTGAGGGGATSLSCPAALTQSQPPMWTSTTPTLTFLRQAPKLPPSCTLVEPHFPGMLASVQAWWVPSPRSPIQTPCQHHVSHPGSFSEPWFQWQEVSFHREEHI